MVCFVGGRVFLLLQIYLNLLIMQLMTTVSLFSTWNADKFQVRKSSNIAALQNRGRDVRPQYFCPPFLTSSRILNSFTKQTRSNKLSMNPQDYSDQSRSSKQINFLLNKAVELINRMTSKKRSDDQKGAEVEATVASREMSRIPVTLSFSATHKHPISLIDPAAALEYLSLPVDAYSVLDSNLVTRSLSSDDTFILSLPLGDLSAASMLVKEGNTGIKLAATLRTEVTVQPDPSKGRVVMESGPIYFTPTANKDSVKKPILGKDDAPSNNSNASTDESVAEVSPSFSDALPEWLLWGGRPVSIDNRDDENSIMINQDGDRIDVHQDALVAEEKVSRDSVKSSVQARFRIELQWKSFKISDLSEKEKSGVSSILARANIMRKSFSLFSKADPESSTSDFKPDNDLEFDLNELSGLSDGGDSSISADRNAPMMPENTDSAVQEKETPQGEKEEDGVVSLPVTAVVKVWVDVNLPVREDLSSALSFPPIKLLLNQAGALTTKALLRTIAPTLGKLLVKDHDNRRKVNGGTSSSKVEDIQTSFKKQENIYDDLTADIEIR